MSTTGYTISEINPDVDFPALIACEWATFEHARTRSFRLWCPIHGSGPDARADAMAESTERQKRWHLANPASHWLKATDADGRIVGGALWKAYASDPDEQKDFSEVYWYPEGGAREFVKQALELYDLPWKRMARRPHWCTSLSLGAQYWRQFAGG